MRRPLSLLLLLLLTVAVAVSAQGDEGALAGGVPLEVAPEHFITGLWQPVELETVSEALAVANVEASDTCSGATVLDLPQGGSTLVNSLTSSPNAAIGDLDPDPVLGCMWGAPASPTGYRTAWYRFTSESSGQVKISTYGSDYDTVLAVYSGSCGNLLQLYCSDDANFLSSEITFLAISGEEYYIEVADWEGPAAGPKSLQFAALIEPVSAWQFVGTLNQGVSRHAAAVVTGGPAPGIYVLGGQTAETSGIPTLTGNVLRYQTDKAGVPGENPIEMRAPMCHRQGDTCEPVFWSGAAAAYVSGRIFIPAGFDGNFSTYNGSHLAYQVSTNTWEEVSDNNWAGGQAPIYYTAVSYGTGPTARYFVVGGLTGPLPFDDPDVEWQARNQVYAYYPAIDPAINPWTNESGLATGRFGHSSAILNIGGEDHLCSVGGIGKDVAGPLVLAGTECRNLVRGTTHMFGPLNRPRYWAGSAVDGDGNWYIYGGRSPGGESVAVTERFDRSTGQWQLLDARYDLGSTLPGTISPPRTWPGGGFVGQTLWSLGGEVNSGSGPLALNLVDKIDLPRRPSMTSAHRLMLPVVRNSEPPGPNNTFARAELLPVNQIRQYRFVDENDVADVFYVTPSFSRPMTVRLTEVPGVYRLHVYSAGKYPVVQSATNEPGTTVNLTFNAVGGNVYYIVVEREWPIPGDTPTGQFYKIVIEG
jgi:hypothetical protein